MDNRAALIPKNVFNILIVKKMHDVIGKFHLNIPPPRRGLGLKEVTALAKRANLQ